jgi:cation diffusion facilitator family transporter
MDKAKKASLISIFILFLLGFLKYFTGILSGSVAVVASAVHYFTDSLASLSVYVGIKISEKEPTRAFPYGFYKVENVISIFLSLLIFFVAYDIVKESITGFGERTLKNLPLAIFVITVSIIASGILSRYKIKVGIETGSPSLLADGKHTLADAYSSFVVLLGLAGYYAGISYADQIAGILVSVLIIHAGYGILVDSIKVLLDASLSYDVLESIKEIAMGFSGVKAVGSIKARSSGKFVFVEMEIEMQMRDLKKAYELSKRIEEGIKRNIKNVDRVLIQVFPVKKEFVRFALPIQENIGISSIISQHFGKAEYFCIFDLREGRVENMKFLQNPFRGLEKKKGIEAARFLIKEGIDILAAKEVLEGKGPWYVLEDAFVETRITKHVTLADAIEEFI